MNVKMMTKATTMNKTLLVQAAVPFKVQDKMAGVMTPLGTGPSYPNKSKKEKEKEV